MMVAANVQFIGIGGLPFLLYCSIRQFLGRSLPGTPVTIGALFIPAVTVVLAFFFPAAGVFRQSVTVVEEFGMAQLAVDYGFWHNAVFAPYQYLLYFVSVLLLFSAAQSSSRVFRARLMLYILAILVPMAGATLYILRVPPFTVLNPTPILVMVSFVVFGVTMLRHHMLDVVPVAHDRVFDTLREAVIVLDLEDRIVDFNRAAASAFPPLADSAVGRSFEDVLGTQDAILALARGIEGEDVGLVLEHALGEGHYLGRSTAVIGMDGTRIGRVITLLKLNPAEADHSRTIDLPPLA
jgi:PAS domain-containing protein